MLPRISLLITLLAFNVVTSSPLTSSSSSSSSSEEDASGGSYYERFISKLFARTSLGELRDQQLRPRLMAQIKLPGSPRVVYSLPNAYSGNNLAVVLTNTTNSHVTLNKITNISKHLADPQANPDMTTIGSSLGWPQQVGEVQGDYLSNVLAPFWWTSTSYYEPENVDGQIVLLPVDEDSSPSRPIVLTPRETKRDYVYWNVQWEDMNGDNWPDVVASRTQGKEADVKSSELIWLENPGRMANLAPNRPWTLHQITQGPDVNFRIMKVPMPSGGSRTVIVGLGYWNHKLYAIWTEDPNEDWTRVDSIKERVIDNHDSFWDVQIADVNGDGRDDVVVSTYVFRSWRSSLFVYELPCDLMRDEWRRHTLIEGGDPMSDEPFNSGPQIKIFHPLVRDGSTHLSQKKKPFILLSGDNDGYLKVLSPRSRKTDNWDYNSQVVFKAAGPVGPVALEDLNHDGSLEIIAPVVSSNRLLVFTFKPMTGGPAHNFVYNVDERRTDIDRLLDSLAAN